MIRIVKLRANFMLLLTALIWGATFVAQKSAMDSIEPFTFNGVRSLIGAFSLFLIGFFIKPKKKIKKRCLIEGGFFAGSLLFLALAFQQIGIVDTTAGKAGFISSLYIVMVPLISVLAGKKIGKTFWMGVILALFGLYFLCGQNGIDGINRGDLSVLFSAVFFALHIICISKYAKRTDPIQMSCLQFLVAGTFSCICAGFFETVNFVNIVSCYKELFYTGVLSCAIGFTLQINAQKHVKPHITSLILSLESVFAVLAGYLFLNEILTIKEMLGCVLMFLAVCAAQYHKKTAA